MKEITLLTVCTIMLAACGDTDIYTKDGNRYTVSEVKVNVSGFTGNADTRTAKSGYQTSFTGDEQIGVFALKTSGSVLLHDNIPYKYNAMTGSWQPVNATDKVYVYGSGVTYYAYYPYSSGMNSKKSVAEITSAFTPSENQSTQTDYTASDLMTGEGTLTGSALNFSFTHAMSLIEIEITANSNTDFTPNPVFYNMQPWEMTTDNLYRYIVKPGVATEVEFEYGPADNRCGYRKTLTPTDVIPGNCTKIKATFENISMELNTGSYIGDLGTPTKVKIDGKDYSLTPVAGSNNRYIISGRRATTSPNTSFDLYIHDNLVNTEQLLLSATLSNLTVDASAKTITVPLSAGGMEGGGSSESNPYLVTTPVQLRGVEVGQTNTTGTGSGRNYYRQMNDIDISTYTSDWKPIKSGALYDGKGYKIKKLNSTRGGIFSFNGGTIQNTHLESGTITGTSEVGGIAGSNHSQKIYNCSNGADITGTGNNIGGITGLGDWSQIMHCKNTGAISGTRHTGGISPYSYGTTIKYCYNTGTITGGTEGNIGGICGVLGDRSGIIEYCYNTGTVTGTISGNLVGHLGWVGKNICQYSFGIATPLIGQISNSATNNTTVFNAATNSWPIYIEGTGDGWTSDHWKSFNNGEYPKLFWEQ